MIGWPPVLSVNWRRVTQCRVPRRVPGRTRTRSTTVRSTVASPGKPSVHLRFVPTSRSLAGSGRNETSSANASADETRAVNVATAPARSGWCAIRVSQSGGGSGRAAAVRGHASADELRAAVEPAHEASFTQAASRPR